MSLAVDRVVKALRSMHHRTEHRMSEPKEKQTEMATTKDYQTGTAAAQSVIEADIEQDVPVFFRDDISAETVARIAAGVAKAVIDAVDAERVKADAAKGHD